MTDGGFHNSLKNYKVTHNHMGCIPAMRFIMALSPKAAYDEAVKKNLIQPVVFDNGNQVYPVPTLEDREGCPF